MSVIYLSVSVYIGTTMSMEISACTFFVTVSSIYLINVYFVSIYILGISVQCFTFFIK